MIIKQSIQKLWDMVKKYKVYLHWLSESEKRENGMLRNRWKNKDWEFSKINDGYDTKQGEK